MSPGPIFAPKGQGVDWWRFLQNCFSCHFTLDVFMVEGGAVRIGCTVIPSGSGQTEMQVQVMAHLVPDTYIGTPSFLKIIIEKAREMKMDISSVQRADGRAGIAGSCKLSSTIAPEACSTAAMMAHRWNAWCA